ncbi:MAG: histidine phosphatase family protein [Elainellaceae cyanobacterium]
MLKLLFVRHAESIGNAQGRMVGQYHDPLTPRGQDQAQQLAFRLQRYVPTCIYASPLQRAAETADILRRSLGALTPITYLDELQEFQNGIFSGLTWAEAQERYPDFCQQLITNRDWISIPEAETLQSGRDRAERVVNQLLTHRSGELVWVVSHHWILQHVVSVLLGCDRTWEFPLDHTGLVEVWLDRDRWAMPEQKLNSALWHVHRFNDVAHLSSQSEAD